MGCFSGTYILKRHVQDLNRPLNTWDGIPISNYRILKNDTLNGTVTFKYKDYADGNAVKLLTGTGKEIVRS